MVIGETFLYTDGFLGGMGIGLALGQDAVTALLYADPFPMLDLGKARVIGRIQELGEPGRKVSNIISTAEANGLQLAEVASLTAVPAVYLLGMQHGQHFNDGETKHMLDVAGAFFAHLRTAHLLPDGSYVGLEFLSQYEHAPNDTVSTIWNRFVETARAADIRLEGRISKELLRQVRTATDTREDGQLPPQLKGEGRAAYRDDLLRMRYAIQLVEQCIVPHITDVVEECPPQFFYVLGKALLYPTQESLKDKHVPFVSFV